MTSSFYWMTNFGGGFVLMSPFLSDFISWYILLPINIIIAIQILITNKFKIHLGIEAVPFLALIVIHSFFVLSTSSPFHEIIKKEILIAGFFLFFYVLSSKSYEDGFIKILISFCVLISTFSILKFILLLNGIGFSFLFASCGLLYPEGTQLCINPIIFTYLLLLGVFFSLMTKKYYLVPLLLVSGFFTESRRFLILIPLIILFFTFFYKHKIPLRWVACYATLVATIIFFQERTSIFLIEEQINIFDVKKSDKYLTIVDSTSNISSLIYTLFTSQVGFDSRLPKIFLGLELLDSAPMGFEYHHHFLFQEHNNIVYDYPHLPLLSEYLIGGGVLLFISIIFILTPIFILFLRKEWAYLFLMIVSFAYFQISGDNLLSVPNLITIMVFMMLKAREVKNSETKSANNSSDTHRY